MDEIMQGIYQLNFSSGDTYIGKSVNISRRIIMHRSSKGLGSPKLQKAYKDHEYLGHTILEECTDDIINERELYYISTLKPTLNTLPGGTGLSGLNHPRCKYTEEQIREVVRLWIETPATPQQIADITDVASSTVHDIIKGRSHIWATQHLDLQEIRDKKNSIVLYDTNNNKYVVQKGTFNDFEKQHTLPAGTVTRIINSPTSKSNLHGFSLHPYNNSLFKLRAPDGTELEVTIDEAKEILKESSVSGYAIRRILDGHISKGWQLYENQSSDKPEQ